MPFFKFYGMTVKKLLDLTKTICEERIECLKKVEQEFKTKK